MFCLKTDEKWAFKDFFLINWPVVLKIFKLTKKYNA